MDTDPRFDGSGPGARTRDGCSVELYRRLPYAGELKPLRPWMPPGTTVLELGCAAGRLTRELLAWGCSVHAIDVSTEMLAHVPPAARTTCAAIESLSLGERFDVVLLTSGLIQHPDAALREAFVERAVAHLLPHGAFALERRPAQWLKALSLGPLGAGASRRADEPVVTVESARHEAELTHATLRYELGGQVWRHAFSMARLHDAQIERLLTDAGLGTVVWLAGTHWARAQARVLRRAA